MNTKTTNCPHQQDSIQYHRYGHSKSPQGFALIATISVMALLIMIALGISSLAALEVRSSRQSNYQNEAKANARMALMLAIGELQKHAGPDQSVTAPGGSLSAQGFAGLDTHDSKSRYVAVYNRRDANDPTTELDGTKWSQSRKDFFRRWMVSGVDGDVQNLGYAASPITAGNNNVKMTSRYTDPANTVYVPTEISNVNGRPNRFGWWVDGLGTKASMVLARETDSDLATILPDRFAIKHAKPDMAWFPSRGDEDQLSKILSMQTADILGGAGAATQHERWLGEQHLMVLADPRRTGLKGDLTSALDSSKATMEKVLGQRMFLPQGGKNAPASDPGGPHWAQAQDYFKMDGSGNLIVQPQKKDQMGVFPVIASFIEVYGMSTTDNYAPTMYPHPSAVSQNYPNYYSTRNNGRVVHVFTAHMAPMVKLWNPYNRPLEATGYTLVVGNNNSQYGSLSRGTTDDVILQGRNGSIPGGYDARLPKPMRYEHRYYIPATTFAAGETKIFALHENRYLDLEGNYTPQSGRSVGAKTDVVKEGWILCNLTEGGFRGYSLWDMHLTKPDIYKEDKDSLNYGGGRAIGGVCPGPNVVDGGDVQILDTEAPGGLEYTIRPHRFVTWNIKLYKGKVKENGGASNYDLPLINMKNVSTDVSGYSKENVSFTQVKDPTTDRFFAKQGGLNAIWARRMSLRHLVNDGDGDMSLYNPTAHPTKDIKWLANYNPRSSTVGCWPKAYRRSAPHIHSKYFVEPKQQITVNGAAVGSDGFGLGTTGNYLTGLTESTIGIQQLIWQNFVGYSDVGGPTRCTLFDVPQGEDAARKFYSIGQLRHANLWIENGIYENVLSNGYGDEDWFSDNMNPAYPIGNSYADPRLKLDENRGLYKKMSISDIQGNYDSTWYDMSWYLNDRLWDKYYFSAKKKASSDESNNPRLIPYGSKTLEDGEDGFRYNASNQLVAGAFNVNSVSPEAWKAFLGSLIGTGGNATGSPFLRSTDPLGGAVSGRTPADDDSAYIGYRELSSSELDDLVTHVVEEVKKRGPFMSLGDFVNRAALSGAPNEYRLMGALQAAIDQTNINSNFKGGDMTIDAAQPDAVYEREAYAGDIAAGVPGYLTQGDLLARTGHLMTVRSDTFKVRAYGESVDSNGRVLARVWCEAVVQRTPDYVNSNDDPSEPAYNEDGTENSAISQASREYGRKFIITSFRWIPKSEIE